MRSFSKEVDGTSFEAGRLCVVEVIHPFVMAFKERSVFILVGSVVRGTIDAGLVLADETDRVIADEPLDHVKFEIVFVVVLFAFLSLEEVEIILGTIASSRNCLFKLTDSALGEVKEDSLV